MRQITPEQLKFYLADAETKPLLIDVREPWEYDICHIEGSQLIPMAQIDSLLDDLNVEQEIVLLCHHGIRSQQVGYRFEGAGFTHIINLNGGIHAWAQTMEKSMATY